MKIDLVLTACNNNNSYLNMYPLVYKVWKKRFNLDCYLILIDNSIPDFLKPYENYIILYSPIEGINTIYIAQTIRILYPAMFDNKNILITDMDIIPVLKTHFIDSVQDLSENAFIAYTDRYIKQKMLAICYNVANSNTWKKIFSINNINDITNLLKNWYDINYEGIKNTKGWFLDQQKLYENVIKYKTEENEVIFLQDKNIQYTHMAPHPTSFFSTAAGTIPFANHNQAPRTTYQSNMAEQAISSPCLTASERHEMNYRHMLWYPQQPVCTTHIAEVKGELFKYLFI